MRIFTVLVFMAAAAALGQTARLGDLGPDSTVVTNAVAGGVVVESDPVAYPVATTALATATNALALAEGALQAEADTLATVTARGATTPDEITAQNFIGGRYGAGAGESVIGDGWGAYGRGAGFEARGSYWGAYGVNAGSSANGYYWGAYGSDAGLYATGNSWGAYGNGAGIYASGDSWGAYGVNAGYKADHNYSHAFGRYAGYAARGDSRLYIDVYASEPAYEANGAINDRIFGDTDGTLYLGRGEGAPGGAVGGTLRGPWTGGGFASYLAATNIAAAAVAGSGHLPTSATNGWTTSSHDGLATTGAVAAVQAEVATLEDETLDPWVDWSATITPVNGTATVTRATGADPVLTLAGATVIDVPTAGWPTTGVARVSLSLWAGTNAVTFQTTGVDYAATPTVSTNGWTTILFRRVGGGKWKGVGL